MVTFFGQVDCFAEIFVTLNSYDELQSSWFEVQTIPVIHPSAVWIMSDKTPVAVPRTDKGSTIVVFDVFVFLVRESQQPKARSW